MAQGHLQESQARPAGEMATVFILRREPWAEGAEASRGEGIWGAGGVWESWGFHPAQTRTQHAMASLSYRVCLSSAPDVLCG